LFEKVDLNEDGELTKSEVIEANALLGLSPDDTEKLFDAMDTAKRGILRTHKSAMIPTSKQAHPGTRLHHCRILAARIESKRRCLERASDLTNGGGDLRWV
jgi:hypothetical protein